MKNTTVKGLLLAGGMLAVVGCTNNPSAPRLSNTIQPMVMKPQTLNPLPDFAREHMPGCRRDNSLLADNCGLESRSATGGMLADSMRDGMFDNLSGRLASGMSGSSRKKNKKSRWRLKRDRVEWQYKF